MPDRGWPRAVALARAACWLVVRLGRAWVHLAQDGQASSGMVVDGDGWPERVRSVGEKKRKGNRVMEKRKKKEKKKNVFVGSGF